MSPEVEAALRPHDLETDNVASRSGVRVYASMLLFVLLLPLLEVRNWFVTVAMVVPMILALLLAVLRARSHRRASEPRLRIRDQSRPCRVPVRLLARHGDLTWERPARGRG